FASPHHPTSSPAASSLLLCLPPRPPLFPYTTLFRSSVAEVLDAWLAPDYRYFKLKGADGDTYLVRHDERSNTWELTMFRGVGSRSEEHTSELQSHLNIVCRLLLEKINTSKRMVPYTT